MLYTPNILMKPDVPVYSALYESIKQDIAAGRLRPKDRLPSIRQMARNLAVSTTPVESAYGQLLAEGFIESRPKRGFYVIPLSESYGLLTLAAEQTAASVSGQEQDAARVAVSAPYDFHMAKVDLEHFPLQTWKKTLNAVLREEYSGLLHYGDAQGEPGLRTELARYLNRFRGVTCRPDQIVIGAEQHLLLHYLAEMLRGSVRSVIIENPCYPLIPSAFRAGGFEVVPGCSADEGIEAFRLPQAPGCMAVVSPAHRFPSGRVMPLQERLHLLEWARKHGCYILEDDYGGELRYQGRPVPALQSLDTTANVIYVGGFSQILAPDICIHYMVLPNPLTGLFHRLKRTLMFEHSSSRIYQRTLQLFMKEGHFEKHVRRMRNIYRKRSRSLMEALESHFGDIGEIHSAEAGLHVRLSLRVLRPAREMIAIARQHGIEVAAASPFYQEEGDRDSEQEDFIIGFGAIQWRLIDEGVRRLRIIWQPYISRY
ncbi:PLP-dependent aminotransferase family protein [Paenibacillus sambharensis]|uniref:PLP-dependent aminotransferase family protein n=1 Tax=Paenibacillus sambharensis TaxID=1803190 RepID=A0A2W1L7E8_9BACL|nr:PLP-dependent aminotransferase family protein [Paenibacillus sambharensis]PZD96108.1 PLP-dependent aminotransferase family protein [Paenibacillus sambharensis]